MKLKCNFKHVIMSIVMFLLITVMPLSADDLLYMSDFNDGIGLPWHISESEEDNSDFELKDGEFVMHVFQPGVDKWDVQIRHRELTIEQGHTYRISFTLRSSVPTRVYAKVGTQGEPYNEYWNNNWNPITIPGPQGITIDETFTMNSATDKLCEFAFHLGGELLTSGVPVDIYFDDIHLEDAQYTRPPKIVIPKRDVRVNQVGYFPVSKKRATIVSGSTSPIDWYLKDASGNTVDSGRTSVFGLDTASEDHVHIADFSDFTTPGTGYVLAIDGADELAESYPFDIKDDIYSIMKYDAFAYFYHSRSATPIEMPYAGRQDLTRPAGHNPDIMATWPDTGQENYSLDVTGGWYDAGDHGKYVVNGGISAWTVMNQYERTLYVEGADKTAFDDGNVNIPEQGNSYPDILDEVRWQMEMMLKMQVPTGHEYTGMVHHKAHDIKWTALAVAPHEDDLDRYLRPVSTAATLNLAATGAQSARLWETFDPAFAAQCLEAAEIAWDAAVENPEIYAPMQKTGGGPYNDTFVEDEFYWAACELYVTTGKEKYRGYIVNSQFYLKMATTLGSGEDKGLSGVFTWGSAQGLGTVTLALVPNGLTSAALETARNNIIAAADHFISIIENEGYMLPMSVSEEGKYPWGSNSFILNEMIVMALAYDFTGDYSYVNGVTESMDYILGRNAMDQSYVTGYGSRPLENPHHRFWSFQSNPDYPKPPAGIVSGGPNSDLQDPWVRGAGLLGTAPQKCFMDHIESWSTNEVTINWNAPFTWVLAFLDEERESGPVPLSAKITAPVSGSEVKKGDIRIAASTTGEAQSVAFYADGSLIGTDAAAPFNYLWQSVSPGTYDLTAVVTGFDGSTADSPVVSITVLDNFKPVVELTSPLNGAAYGLDDQVLLTADASDVDGSINYVDFIINNVVVYTDTTYPYSYNAGTMAEGTYQIVAVAVDNEFADGVSEIAEITVSEVVKFPPVVEITAPAAGSKIDEGKTISITASASDADGQVELVEFFVDGEKIGQDAAFPYSFNWSGAAVGIYSISARATDNDGLKGISEAVSIEVEEVVIPEGDLAVQYEVGNSTASTHQITGKFNIVNRGQAAVALDSLKFRYYYTLEQNAGQTFNCYYAVMGQDNVSASFGTEGGEHYVEVSLSGSGSIAAGSQTGEIQFAINNNNWSQYNQTNDHSFNADASGLTDNANIVLYRDGKIVWGKGPGTGPVDEDPVVNITAPANGETFTEGDDVVITASATDDNSVTKVDFYNGTTLLGTDTTAPYSYTLANAAAGTYTLGATATDNAGNTDSDSVSITVEPIAVDQDPVVTITAPANGAEFTEGESITISATATDDNGVTKVDFYNRTTLLGTDTTAPYSYTIANAAAGTYTLGATATDTAGNSATDTVTITVKPVGIDEDPVVIITAPANGAEFIEGASITISATATDDNGVTKVDFYNGSSLLASDSSAPYGYTISNAAAGTFLLKAIATDNAGNTAEDSVTVTVKEDIQVESDLVVQYTTSNTNSSTNQITGQFNVVNNGEASVALDGLVIRYYYSLEKEVGQTFNCYYAVIGSGNIAGSFGTETGENYFEIALGGSGSIPAGGQTGQIQYSVNNNDWSAYNQDNDHSFNADAASFIDWENVVLYQNGTKVWGKGPNSGPEKFPPTVTITSPADNSTYLAGASVTIQAAAADSDGTVEKVEFFNGTTLLGSDTTAPYSFTIGPLTGASYVIKAVATDNDGLTDEDSVTIRQESEPTEGFQVVGTSLIDANGNPFVMRGVNHAHTWYKSSLSQAIPAIAQNGSNTVRVVLSNGEQWTKDDAASVKEIIELCKANNMIAVLEVHDATGYNDVESLQKAADYFIEIKDAIIGEEAYVIVNIANEWYGQWDGPEWADGYSQVIPALRAAGLTHTILVDCAGYGQYPASVHNYGKAVLAADPNANTMFAIHFYEYSGGTPEMVKSNIDKTIDQGLCLTIGEFGFKHADGDVAEQTVLDYCQEKNVGWLAWSWFGNSGGVEYLDLAADAAATSLSAWGETVVNGTNGLKETSEICSVFGGPVKVAPTVSITSPANGSEYTAGEELTIKADANDSDGTVEKVDFYNGSSLLGTDTTPPYTYTIAALSASSYSLTAVATDNDGKKGTSSVVTISKPIEPTDGFQIVNGRLIDANGNDFIMRGVNHAHTWYKSSSVTAIPAIAENGSNTVRIVLSNGQQWDKDDAASVKEVIELCKANNMITVLEVHDATGYNDAASLMLAADYFIEIKDAIIGEEAYVIVNIANEWMGQQNGQAWAAAYTDAIGSLRAAGLTHTILVDAGGWGQHAASVHDYGQEVFASDPLSNTMFAIHFYEYAGGTPEAVRTNIDKAIDQGLCLTIGEFGFKHLGNDVAEQEILDYCQEKNVGWLAWSWFGNGDEVAYLDLAANAAATSLSDWGKQIVYGTNGLMETSEICSVFGNVVLPKPPLTTITSPETGSNYAPGSSLTITAESFDVDGTVARVDFYDGQTLLGSDMSAPYSFTIVSLDNDSYELTAVGTDNEGNSKSSGIVRIRKELGADDILVECEDGILKGTAIADSRTGYSGTGYVSSFDDDNDALELTVNVNAAGTYTLVLGYAAPYGPKMTDMVVNGGAAVAIQMLEGTDFVETEAVEVQLDAGSNSIEFQRSWGWYELDYIRLSPVQ